jgi:hypothetical protein
MLRELSGSPGVGNVSGLQGLRGLRLDRPQLYFDYERDRDLVDLLGRLGGEAGGEPAIPGALNFRIKNGSVTLAGLGRLDRVNLDARIRDGWIDAQGVWNATVAFAGWDGRAAEDGAGDPAEGGAASRSFALPVLFEPALFDRPLRIPALNLSTAGRFRFSGATDFTEGTAFLSIPFIAEDRFRTGSIELNLALRDRILRVNNASPGMEAGRGTPVVFGLDYGLDTGDLSVRLVCDEYSPGDFIRLRGPWGEQNRFLALRTSGGAALSYSPEGALDYHADLTGIIPPGLPLGRSGFKIGLAGDRDRVRFDTLELTLARGRAGDQPGGTVRFRGDLGLPALTPNGTLSVQDLSLTGRGDITTLLTLRSRGEDLNVFAETLTVGGAEFTALELDLYRREGGLSFNAGALRFYEDSEGASSSQAALNMSTIQADGTFDFSPPHLETRLTLDSYSLRDFVEVASPLVEPFEFPSQLPPRLPEFGENLLRHSQITTEIFATTDFKHLFYNAPRLVISYSGYQDIIALFSVSGTDRRFNVDEGQILWNGGSGRLVGQSDFSDPDNISFVVNIGYQDLNYYLTGALLERRTLSLGGSYGLSGFISSGGEGTYSGYFKGEQIPLSLGGQIASLSFGASLRYLSSRSWQLDLIQFELADLAAPGSSQYYAGNGGLLKLSGRVDQDQILLREISFDDTQGILVGNGAFSFSADETGLYRGHFSVAGREHRESYLVDLSWRPPADPEGTAAAGGTAETASAPGISPGSGDTLFARGTPSIEDLSSVGEFRMELSGVGMRLGRFSGKIPNALADGDLRLEWESLKNFNLRLNLHSLSGSRGGQAFNLSGRVFMDSGEFRLEELNAKMGSLEALVPHLRLSLGESRMEGDGRVQGKISGRDLGLDFSLNSRFAPIDSWPGYAEALENFQGTLRISNAAIDDWKREESFDFVFSREGEGIVFSGGPENMIFFAIRPEGSFIAAFSDPFPVRGSFQGSISLSSIDARGEGIEVDLPAIWRFIPTREEFNIAAGRAVGSLQIRGPLGDPEFFGSARGEGLRMQVPSFLAEDIVPQQLSLVFDGTEMRFDHVAAECGKGMGMISGQFWLEKWIPTSFSLDITVLKDRPLPFSFDIGGVLARGTASGTMKIGMTDLVLNVSGDLIAQETEISLNAAEIAASQREDAWGDLTIPVVTDIGITTGKKVEFLWPTREFPMLQAYADMGAKARIYANSLDRSFTFTGDVKLRSGEVFYFERSFYIRNGILSFKETQNQFDPRITVRAEARDRSSTGPVTISMVVDNAPLQSFTARFESSPALSQIEIFSLLGQNFVGSARDDGSVSNPFLASSVDLLAQSAVLRRVQGALRNFLHLDMFSFRTQFIQNAAFSFIGLQDQPVDRIGWVGNYFDNTSVFVGKYIGSEVFTQAMLSLRYDDKKRTFGGYTIEPDLGIELQSPLGNIRWNLVPTHPENWYINDCSFTISWNFSF